MSLESLSQRGPNYELQRKRNMWQIGMIMAYAEQARKQNIQITEDEAAMEWIAKYGALFGDRFDHPATRQDMEKLKTSQELQAYLDRSVEQEKEQARLNATS